MICWPGHIAPGTSSCPHIATDLFSTALQAAGGDPSEYQTDGESLLSMLIDGTERPHEELYWELEEQTAVRAGNYKLVLDGRLEETAEKRADVFLADLSKDPGEWVNLAEELPELTAALTEKALKWREGIETTWETEFQKNYSLT